MFREIKVLLQSEIDSGVPFEDALKTVERLVFSSKDLTHSAVKEAVIIASRYVTRHAIKEQRRSIFKSAQRISESRESGAVALREKVARLMDFRLPGGKPIAECTGTECLEASDFYAMLSRTNATRSTWLKSVASRAGSRIVGEILNESDLQALYNSMEHHQWPSIDQLTG